MSVHVVEADDLVVHVVVVADNSVQIVEADDLVVHVVVV